MRGRCVVVGALKIKVDKIFLNNKFKRHTVTTSTDSVFTDLISNSR